MLNLLAVSFYHQLFLIRFYFIFPFQFRYTISFFIGTTFGNMNVDISLDVRADIGTRMIPSPLSLVFVVSVSSRAECSVLFSLLLLIDIAVKLINYVNFFLIGHYCTIFFVDVYVNHSQLGHQVIQVLD